MYTLPKKGKNNWEDQKIVFDCMIFLQTAARPTGPAAALLELVEIGAIELFVSDATLEELRDVLTRPSLQRKFPSLTTSAVSDFVERIKLSSICFGKHSEHLSV